VREELPFHLETVLTLAAPNFVALPLANICGDGVMNAE